MELSDGIADHPLVLPHEYSGDEMLPAFEILIDGGPAHLAAAAMSSTVVRLTPKCWKHLRQSREAWFWQRRRLGWVAVPAAGSGHVTN